LHCTAQSVRCREQNFPGRSVRQIVVVDQEARELLERSLHAANALYSDVLIELETCAEGPGGGRCGPGGVGLRVHIRCADT
jgi:hypothetical protein